MEESVVRRLDLRSRIWRLVKWVMFYFEWEALVGRFGGEGRGNGTFISVILFLPSQSSSRFVRLSRFSISYPFVSMVEDHGRRS